MAGYDRPKSLSPFGVAVNGSRSGLLERAKQPLHFGPLRRIRWKAAQQILSGSPGLGPPAETRIRQREIEARLVQVRVGRERVLQRRDRRGMLAPRRLQDPEIRRHDRIGGLALPRLLEHARGAGQIVAPAQTLGQPALRAGPWEAAVHRPREFLIGG